ncbi:MAG TPA: hypothetical protein VHZ55_03970 [Bryobacteraceae bacterium]|jgi:uncharacterized membrane protein YkoI|nr:hypothetical protein [Bryobacteraceae bacterium]
MPAHSSTPQNVALPEDLILKALTAAVGAVYDANNSIDSTSDSVADPVVDFFGRSVPAVPGSEDPPEICNSTDAKTTGLVKPFCAQVEFDKEKANGSYLSSKSEAEHTFRVALSMWTLAKSQYTLAVANAEQAYQSVVSAATTTYNDKTNEDSDSRDKNLYYQMQQAVATALISFEGAMSDAGGALASAAGTLIAAYVAYFGQVQKAASTKISDRATALVTFWSSVESKLDSNG